MFNLLPVHPPATRPSAYLPPNKNNLSRPISYSTTNNLSFSGFLHTCPENKLYGVLFVQQTINPPLSTAHTPYNKSYYVKSILQFKILTVYGGVHTDVMEPI